MIVIVCTEDRGGMLFNNRRVSKDRTVIQKILELSEGKKLWIHPFSEKLFVEWKSGGWNISFGACRLCATGKSVI